MFRFCFFAFILCFSFAAAVAQSSDTLLPVADAYVRNGSYASTNYGKDTSLAAKSSTTSGYTKLSYLKFSLSSLSNISSAKLRIYGRNTDNTSSISISVYGVDSDSWTESGITWNNAPAASTSVLSAAGVNDQGAYYDFDVTNYVKTQSAGDKVVSFLIKDAATQNKNIVFNSKENLNNPPRLVIGSNTNDTAVNDTTPPVVKILFNDSSNSANSYNNKVNITINSSDQGGSGLAYSQYSLNRAGYKNYDSSFIIDSAGSYTITAKAADGKGNTSVTNEIAFRVVSQSPSSSKTLSPIADAFVRNGSYGAINYGTDTALVVKGATSSGFARMSYLKFSLDSITTVGSAKLRIYGRNADNTTSTNISAFGVDTDSWTESGITFNNAPTASASALTSAGVTDQPKYYEFDVTDYVKTQAAGDKVVSFAMKDIANQNRNIVFNSKENTNNPPQLVIGTASNGGTPAPAPAPTPTPAPNNSLLFVENPDKFPSNDHFVFSHIQIPWTRDSIYTVNHDSLRIRMHNNGIDPLTVSNLILSNTSGWKIDNINGVTYAPASSLPLTISSGAYKDVIVKFIAVDQATRVKVLHDSLTIVSNDSKTPLKKVLLSGLWQKEGEGLNEPSAQEVINTLGFNTRTGFGQTDPDKGDTTKLKGDEILPSYFVRADTSRPVSVIQIAAYHGCCNTNPETINWYSKGATSTARALLTHVLVDGQTVLPRKGKPNTPADATFTPTGAFGFRVGSHAWTDPKLNTGGKTAIKVWKAIDQNGNIIPNAYIIANDYLGTQYTNYDYQDNVYFIKNVKPERGPALFSALGATPSALDFGENIVQTNNSLILNLNNTGKTYADSSKDPAITISSLAIVGENKSEFSAAMPVKTTLNAQESTTLNISFKPTSQGLKIADLLIYYKNAQSPLRVPLYGIAKTSGTTVTANYRVNSGAKTPLTINGKTWSADNQYSFDNLEPFSNAKVTQIAGTDEDSLYLKEQSSNADKKPFRYEFPVENGDYVVRLHFAELYWGAAGSGFTGGAGSRVMSVSLENQLRLINFDVTQEAGGATALVKNIPVTVTDGKLNIDFSSTVNRPMVCAVEVYSFRSAPTAARSRNNQSTPVFENNLKKARVYPNPVQKIMHIQFPAKYPGNSTLQIADVAGRIYEIGRIKLQGSALNTIEVNISNLSLKPGFYYLRILSETRPPEAIKLVVE